MNTIGQILLESAVTDRQVANALAEAFGVERVTVWPMGEVDDMNADLVVQREHVSGEFPHALQLTATDRERSNDQVIEGLRNLARLLGQFLLTDEAGITPAFDDDFLLVSPNGETTMVDARNDALSDGRIELTPESLARRARLMATPLAG
ncbi:MAG TPA: hypothetical protein VEW66_09170 [Thermomicrobiales bacterium]|nr:hypothetical protein [Thermomicrobiales bacterium]